jgi:hypothetical protein
MKAFVVAVVLAVLLALGSGYVLEAYFSQEADQKFAAPSARVGPGGTPEERGWFPILGRTRG